jgi:hypothetical protein
MRNAPPARRVARALLTLVLVCPLAAGAAETPKPVLSGMPAVDFENPSLPPREKELLTRYAQQVSRWAMIQRVVQAVAAQDQTPRSDEKIREIDAAWQKGGDPEGLATALQQNDCAQALQALINSNPGWAEAMVTDRKGALVCASQRTSDYWQGDEPKFSRAWAEGAGALFVSSAAKDSSTGLEMVHIAVPVRVAGKPAGVLIIGKLMGGG